MKRAKAARNIPRTRRPGPPALALHAGDLEPGWAGMAEWIIIAIAGVALLIVGFVIHRVGDYSAESDFYGGYVQGARLIQSGLIDPTRYRVVGPAYDLLLAIVARLSGDFFVAARLIAIASAIGTLIVWRALVRSRVGGAAALWTTAFLVANPLFFQYGYSATSHMPAAFLYVASLGVLLVRPSGRRAFVAGSIAGASFLMRYPALVLLPATWLILLWLDPSTGSSRRRMALLHLGGFLLLVGPWVAFSLSRGQVPAEELFSRAGFYLTPEVASRNVQDLPGAFSDSSELHDESLGGILKHRPGYLVIRFAAGFGEHLLRDARELVGMAVVPLILLGAVLSAWAGSWKRLLPLWVPWQMHVILLAPVFYGPLYGLPLLPFYSTLAGVALASGRLALLWRRVSFKWILALVPLGLCVSRTLAGIDAHRANTPYEVLEAGGALSARATTADRVLSRKGHIGYYGNMPVVAFPRVHELADLARLCRRSGATYIYYSWYEALLRPEFYYLLDTTATVPGLRLIHRTEKAPSSLFHVEPAFGRDPDWWDTPGLRGLHTARGAVQVLPDTLAWRYHLILARDAGSRRDAGAMQVHADAALRGQPGSAEAWVLRGFALHAMGRPNEARDAYETALQLQPDNPAAQQGLQLLRRR